MKSLSLALIAAVFAPAAVIAQQHEQGYDPSRPAVEQEPSRFPVLRRTLRQIRNDIRSHAGAVRDTAGFIRQDIKSTIRGQEPPRGGNRYGYRGGSTDPARPQFRPYDRSPTPYSGSYSDVEERRQTQMRPTYPQQQPDRREARRHIPSPQYQFPAPAEPSPPQPQLPQLPQLRPAQPEKEPEPEPKIVAPAPKPKSAEQQPRTESQPKPGSKPVEGKIEFPAAKPSDRPGFHFSPYAPYELLDTQDIEPGGLAKDPGNGKIFRVPK